MKRLSRAASRRTLIADRSRRAKWSRRGFRDDRDPATLGRPVGSLGCWCGNDVHGWPGDTEGAPHPRDWPGKDAGEPYPVPEGFEKHARVRAMEAAWSACCYNPERSNFRYPGMTPCGGPMRLRTREIEGIEARYWICQAHEDEEAAQAAQPDAAGET